MQTKIIYEDDYIMVCHKPAGLAVQSGKIGQPDMVSELKKYLADVSKKKSSGLGKTQAPFLGIVHRLDQPVEGLLVFTKTKDAAGKLSAQLVEGSLNKQYYAVVCGKPQQVQGTLVDYLLKEGNAAKVVGDPKEHPEVKKAVLQYRLVGTQVVDEELSGDVAQDVVSLLDITIETGRFHQIRVQMSHAGLPLLGDTKYGSEVSQRLSRSQNVRSVALYAYKLDFVHPYTKKKLEFVIKPSMPVFMEI